MWRAWDEPNGGSSLSFTMLTVNANEHALMKRFHRQGDEKRSVVMLRPEEYGDWLGSRIPDESRSFPKRARVPHRSRRASREGHPVKRIYSSLVSERMAGNPHKMMGSNLKSVLNSAGRLLVGRELKALCWIVILVVVGSSEPVRILVCRGHETITETTSYDRSNREQEEQEPEGAEAVPRRADGSIAGADSEQGRRVGSRRIGPGRAVEEATG
ncbi:SOS response-associated peptidase family protein [Paraburkholderia strydomiana]|uniref:hypothetical protein n=1 Tax=Paraburkholderia strydomiana TaxID=1245417 RepID=UPI0038B93E9E